MPKLSKKFSTLPKHWKHMCRRAGLRPEAHYKQSYQWWYLQGHGRHWRVTALGYFQSSEPYGTFDRWANSGSGHRVLVPQTQRELELFVRYRDHDTRPATAL